MGNTLNSSYIFMDWIVVNRCVVTSILNKDTVISYGIEIVYPPK